MRRAQMIRRTALVAALALSLGFLAYLVVKTGDVRRVVRPEAEFLIVDDEYALILLKPEFLTSLFGNSWHTHQLFYGTNRGMFPGGVKAAVSSSALLPMAKGTPIIVVSGTRWPDLVCVIFSMDAEKQVVLAIDVEKPAIRVASRPSARKGSPTITKEGRLLFLTQ